MDFSVKAALLASHYPCQMRVNIMLQQLGQSSAGVVFFNGMLGFVNNVVTRPAIKARLEAMQNFNEHDANVAIKDVELVEACKASWSELGTYVSGQYTSTSVATSNTVTPNGTPI